MDTRKRSLTYQEWMDKVDAAVQRKTGLGAMDLDDFCYRDAYEEGEAPGRTAAAAIRNAGGMDF